jgi:hypothetical protein
VEVITGAGGGVVSMVHEKLVALLWFPAASCASTEKVWLPWLSSPWQKWDVHSAMRKMGVALQAA